MQLVGYKNGAPVSGASLIQSVVNASGGGQLIASVLYGVNPRDPVVFTMMAVTLLLVALAACWLPARRAAKLDPTIALRAE